MALGATVPCTGRTLWYLNGAWGFVSIHVRPHIRSCFEDLFTFRSPSAVRRAPYVRFVSETIRMRGAPRRCWRSAPWALHVRVRSGEGRAQRRTHRACAYFVTIARRRAVYSIAVNHGKTELGHALPMNGRMGMWVWLMPGCGDVPWPGQSRLCTGR